jgi:hypothetical protein
MPGRLLLGLARPNVLPVIVFILCHGRLLGCASSRRCCLQAAIALPFGLSGKARFTQPMQLIAGIRFGGIRELR